MPNAHTRRLVSRAVAGITAAVALVGACKDEDASSRLKERSQPLATPVSPTGTPMKSPTRDEAEPAATRPPEGPAATSPAASTPDASQPTDVIVEGSEPPPDAERIQLRLALPEGQTYRVTTVAMVELPMVGQPTGYAREENIVFERCKGDGVDRVCTLRHRYSKFEAEPPTGPLLEEDERRVQPFTSRHELTATGYREGKTRLEGGPPDADEKSFVQDLASVHRFYCLRFPKDPVAVGAKWKDECRTFDRGVAVTRRVLWELTELTDDPVSGKRAELRAVGEYIVPGSQGERKGTIEIIFYLFAERGEPHLLRERRSIPVSAERGAYTKNTVNIQFAKVSDEDPERVMRTDGQPFPSTPAAPVPQAATGPSESTPSEAAAAR